MKGPKDPDPLPRQIGHDDDNSTGAPVEPRKGPTTPPGGKVGTQTPPETWKPYKPGIEVNEKGQLRTVPKE